jgi:drug/metabolite transporter (DMT)-like permease
MSPSAAHRLPPPGGFAPVAALLFNALVWGVSWWPFRQLDALGLHSLWATAQAYVLASALVVAWRPTAWREAVSSPGLWLLALASGITNAAFNWGVTVGEVVRVVLLFYLMPVWAALLARLLLREPLSAAVLVRVAMALAGAAIVLSPGNGTWAGPLALADWLGLVGGFGFALTNVILRREAARPDAARALAMFVGAVGVAGGLAVVLAGAGTVAAPPAPAPAWVIGTAALALALLAGNLALQYGAARLPAAATAVILLTEVLFATLSAVWLGDEVLTARKLAGGALIIGAALLASLQIPLPTRALVRERR